MSRTIVRFPGATMLQRMSGDLHRILMTVDAVGGVWQHALGLAEQLVSSGHFVVLAGVGPLPDPEQRRNAETIASVEWLHTPPEWMARNEGELEGLASELDCLVRKHAIDLVHVNEPGQAADLRLPCPVVAVSHSCILTWFRAVRHSRLPNDWEWHERRTRIGMRRADLVIAPSASHAAALKECYGTIPQLVVVHNGISPSMVSTGQRDHIVFAAGRWWDSGKNGDVLDEAALRTSWPIRAAGATRGPNGEVRPFRNVTSLGPISNSETRILAACCGVFVSPSLYEPFGLAALEAATAGTPLVLADIPTYRELWSDAAVFFPARDAAALATELNHLANNDQLRRELGAKALSRSRSYTLQRQAAAMRGAYKEAAAIHAGRV